MLRRFVEFSLGFLTAAAPSHYGEKMIPQKISRKTFAPLPGHHFMALVVTTFMFWTLGISNASSQAAPQIDSSTIRIEPGPTLTFQFQATGQAANAFAIETATDFHASCRDTVPIAIAVEGRDASGIAWSRLACSAGDEAFEVRPGGGEPGV